MHRSRIAWQKYEAEAKMVHCFSAAFPGRGDHWSPVVFGEMRSFRAIGDRPYGVKHGAVIFVGWDGMNKA